MPRPFRLGIAVIAWSALFSCGCDEPPQPGRGIGQTPPEIRGVDMNGQRISSEEYRGKVVLLDFWGTWCGPCRQMIPHEVELMNRYQNRPFAIVGVAADDAGRLKAFNEIQPLSWKNFVDPTQSIAREFGVESYPTLLLIDHKGVIRKKWSGFSEGMMQEINSAVAEAVKKAE